MDEELNNYLESGDYLPEFLRDFHEQKKFFKLMHHLQEGNEGQEHTPNWVDGHVYTIDRVLWFFAARGYTLQKCRKNIQFKEISIGE